MNRKLLFFVFFFALLLTLGLLNRQYLSLASLDAHERILRHHVRVHPATSLLIAWAAYVAASLIPGTAGKSLVYGWLFGIWWGTLLVSTALTIAAVITFQFSRYVFRDALWSKYGSRLEQLDRQFQRNGVFYLLLLRLMHAPYTFLNYAMGATTIRLRDFWWATQLGVLPGSFIMVYAGARLPTLADISQRGALGALTADLLATLLVLSLLPLVIRALVRRIWSRHTDPRP